MKKAPYPGVESLYEDAILARESEDIRDAETL